MTLNAAGLQPRHDTLRCGQRRPFVSYNSAPLPHRGSLIRKRDEGTLAPGAFPSVSPKLPIHPWRNAASSQQARWVECSSSGRSAATTVPRTSPTFRVRLIQPVNVPRSDECDKLLVYLPGTDGTGQAILPQIPALRSCGYDVWCLYLPPDDRSDWEQLTTQVTLLLRQLLQHWRGGHPAAAAAAAARTAPPSTTSATSNGSATATAPPPPPPPRITIVAESFGCCLALRLAASGAGPELLDRMVLVNPATSFNRSLSGLSSLIAATNLLSLFPRDWYAIAQTTLLPLLVDGGRVEPANQRLLQSMILMEPPASSQSFGFGAPPPSAAEASPDITSGDHGAPARNGPGSNGATTNNNSSPGSSTGVNGDDSLGASAGGGGGSGAGAGTLYYGPAAAANFRANLLRDGDPGEEVLGRVTTPVLLITSARDRLLPSILEGARLERALPYARRYILPDSGHAAMLERGFDLPTVMRAAGFSHDLADPRVAQPGRVRPTGGAAVGAGSAAAVPSAAGSAGAGASALLAQRVAPVEGSGGAPTERSLAGGGGGAGAGASASGRSYQLDASPGPTATAVAVEGAGTGPAAAAPSPAYPPLPASERQAGEKSGSAGAAAAITAGDDGGGGGTQRAARRRAAVMAAGGGGGASGGPPSGGSEEEEVPRADIDSAFDEWCQNLGLWRDVVSPVVLGFEHLPPPGSPAFSRPMLFVGNHQKMGFYDTPLLVYELYVRGYRVRGLAHPGHWAGPMGRWFESFGSVKASPMAAFRLLRSSEKVLLFPGGAKEVVKKRGQEYTLLWKDSPDFVRLAARCNALIVPFAAVGADDAYDVIMDTDEVIAHPVLGPLTTGLLSRVSSALRPEESIFPITKLPVVGLPTPIPLPNLQRLYFQFSPPVDPRALGVNINDTQQVQELYNGIKGTVTQCMSDLLAVRDADEESQLTARLTKSLQRMVPVLGAATAPVPPSPPPPSSS